MRFLDFSDGSHKNVARFGPYPSMRNARTTNSPLKGFVCKFYIILQTFAIPYGSIAFIITIAQTRSGGP